MSSPFAREFAARDPALPGLTTLLDPDAFRARLQRGLPGHELHRATPRYIRYKPGVNCLVAYQLDIDGTCVDAYAKAYRPDDDKLAVTERLPVAGGPFGPGRVPLDDLAATALIFPNDDKLPALAHLGSTDGLPDVVQRLLPDRPDLLAARLRTLRYKPERRLVASLAGSDTPAAVLKFYTEHGFEAARRAPRVFPSCGPLRIPRRLGRSRRLRALAFEWLAGHPLDEVCADPHVDPRRLTLVGQALAALHASSCDGLTVRARDTEAADLLATAATIAAVYPALEARAGAMALCIGAELTRHPGELRPAHGDFYAMQVVLLDDEVGLLDLDRAALADPAADLGSFVAHLEREVVRGALTRARAGELAAALLDGYATADARPLARVAAYTAARLFKLAIEPFRYLEPDWPTRTAALIDRAEALLPQRHVAQGTAPGSVSSHAG